MVRLFVDRYVDVPLADKKLAEEDLWMPPRDPALRNNDAAYGYEPARSLTEALARGLDDPEIAFALYLPAEDAYGAMIGFTHDGNVVLALEVDDPMNEPGPRTAARALLDELVSVFNPRQAMLCCEEPPPLSEAEFLQTAASMGIAAG